MTQLLRDEPVEVEETRDGWCRVRTAYDYPGWVRRHALVDGTGTLTGASPYRDLIEAARSYLGAPYEWGGLTERGIDCSGLVHMAFRACGRLVPRDADQQEAAGFRLDAAEAGALLSYGDGVADHVAFWLGGGRILHATGRRGVRAVVEEEEPENYRARRRRFFRL